MHVAAAFVFQTEMASLKADNDRLSRMVTTQGNTQTLHTPVSPTGSTASPSSPGIMSLDKRLSLTEMTSLGEWPADLKLFFAC